ncbi:hypothetical protein, partial [Caballeronia cordobensis]|uniref:hypothetical protein n=1 Tax=Caballeronia cordobensis TaxID=1353886 RepID=UPI001F39F2F1
AFAFARRKRDRAEAKTRGRSAAKGASRTAQFGQFLPFVGIVAPSFKRLLCSTQRSFDPNACSDGV